MYVSRVCVLVFAAAVGLLVGCLDFGSLRRCAEGQCATPASDSGGMEDLGGDGGEKSDLALSSDGGTGEPQLCDGRGLNPPDYNVACGGWFGKPATCNRLLAACEDDATCVKNGPRDEAKGQDGDCASGYCLTAIPGGRCLNGPLVAWFNFSNIGGAKKLRCQKSAADGGATFDTLISAGEYGHSPPGGYVKCWAVDLAGSPIRTGLEAKIYKYKLIGGGVETILCTFNNNDIGFRTDGAPCGD